MVLANGLEGLENKLEMPKPPNCKLISKPHVSNILPHVLKSCGGALKREDVVDLLSKILNFATNTIEDQLCKNIHQINGVCVQYFHHTYGLFLKETGIEPENPCKYNNQIVNQTLCSYCKDCKQGKGCEQNDLTKEKKEKIISQLRKEYTQEFSIKNFEKFSYTPEEIQDYVNEILEFLKEPKPTKELRKILGSHYVRKIERLGDEHSLLIHTQYVQKESMYRGPQGSYVTSVYEKLYVILPENSELFDALSHCNISKNRNASTKVSLEICKEYCKMYPNCKISKYRKILKIPIKS